MVQMPTTSSESAPVRLFRFCLLLVLFFLLLLLLLLLSCNAREDLFFRGEESPRNEHFCSSPRAGGFPFFSLLSLSLSLRRHFGRARSVIFFFVVVVFVARFSATLTDPSRGVFF